MGRTIKKTDALVEMVNAFDSNDTKRSNKISHVIQRNLVSESKDNKYREYICVNDVEKQLFPLKKRCSTESSNLLVASPSGIAIELEDGVYNMDINKDGHVCFYKANDTP